MPASGSVLIVDDDIAALDLAVRLLTRAGYAVAQARTGAQAVRLAKQLRPDLMLLEVALADESGLDVLRDIKADVALEQTSVVLLGSQSVSADARSAGLDAGADGFMARPMPDQELLARVRMHLRQHARAHARPASEACFRALVVHQADALLVIDRSGWILFANPAAQTLFGRPAADLVGTRFEVPIAGALRQEMHIHPPGASAIVAEMHMAPSRWEGKPAWLASLRDITQRAQAEQAQAHLLNILETCLNEVYYFDPDSLRFEYANPGALRNLGYSLEAVRERTPLDLKPEFTEAAFRQLIAPLIRREKAQQHFETLHRRADGSHYPVEVMLQLVERRNKQLLLAVIRDDTGRRQAERARDASEDRFRLLWQASPNAIVLLDRDNIIRYANPALQQVFGHDPSAVIGQSLSLLQPRHLAASHARGLRRHLETGKRTMDWRSVETIGRHKDGHEFPVEIAFSSMEIGGEPMFAGFMRDVTERKQAEQSARDSAERFRLLSKASRDAIWDWDLQADTLWWNEGYQELFGLRHDPSQAGMQEREAAMHPQDRERVMAGIREAIAGSASVWSDSYRLLRGDGSLAQVDDRGYLIRDAAGLAIRMVGALTDVTARAQLEEQLRQSQRLESIGQLTGGVAHDFNNLLTVIQGNAELLHEELVRHPRHRELASMIGSAAQRGAELTQRLLAFARKQPLDPKPVDGNRLIASFDALLRRTLGEHIEIATATEPHLWPALADAVQLESALLNLCINSRDAMPEGGRLTIETANVQLDQAYASRHADLRPGDYVMLAVSDSGHGMEPGVVARVFEPFFTTKQTGKGNGLGLSMVYGFAKQSNGHVSIYSEPGHGTTVRLYLPRVRQPADRRTIAPGRPGSRGGGETILLVEDDAMVRGYARGQLTALGYGVIETPDGHRALDILRSGATIDLLFTDIVMPGMGGRQLVEQARLVRPGLKVLYTSGYTENAVIHDGKLAPDVHLLSKPYRRSALADKLREVLDS